VLMSRQSTFGKYMHTYCLKIQLEVYIGKVSLMHPRNA